jgi:hypothetical protein
MNSDNVLCLIGLLGRITHPTQRGLDESDSAAFSSIFLASIFPAPKQSRVIEPVEIHVRPSFSNENH